MQTLARLSARARGSSGRGPGPGGWLWLLIAFAVSGCAGSRALERRPPAADTKLPPEYHIQPGDLLEIRFYYSPEHNMKLVVRPDGVVSMPLAGGVKAAGRTPRWLGEELTRAYARELRDPHVTVMLRASAAQRVFVSGEVIEPRETELYGGMTALHAVARAGGFTPEANPSDTLIIRRSGNGRPGAFKVDLGKVASGAAPELDPQLEAGDIIHVPRSAIANVNLWVQQYVRDILPFDLKLGFRYSLFEEDAEDDVLFPAESEDDTQG